MAAGLYIGGQAIGAVKVGIFTPDGSVDTSDATAIASDILSGKTAYVNGTKVTGSIQSKSAAIYTPGTADQTIASGQYLSGAQTIQGDTNLVASNIKSGVSIFGVEGSHVCESGIDTSDATATASDIAKDETAYVNGNKITGTIPTTESGIIHTPNGDYVPSFSAAETEILSFKHTFTSEDRLFRQRSAIKLTSKLSNFGDATASDVISGKTFTSAAGLKITGTHECNGGSSTPTLQAKTVAPSESQQTVSPDSGYDGLSSVTVDAISTTYVGSGVTQKSAATYTPTTSDQTIASGQYLSGAQTIKGDANLIAGNIKSGVSIFGVAGSYAGSSSSGSSMTMKSGTTTSATIDTGLSNISAIVIYKDSLRATGLIQGVYITDEDTLHYTYCSQYSSYYKTCATSTSTASSVSGGTFTLGTSGTSGLSSSTTYNWVAFGTE